MPWLAPQSTKLMLPTSATAPWSRISLAASCEDCSGFHASSSIRYLTGRPPMPPLAFRHLKYAEAASPDELKLSGPVTLTMPPITIGSPAAALPLFRPHVAFAARASPLEMTAADVI